MRATEGYTPSIAGQRRAVVPVYSLVVATEPSSEAQWAEVGLADRPTFSEHRHLIVYGQRTADDRLVFGGRARRTTSGSAVASGLDPRRARLGLVAGGGGGAVPDLRGVAFTHAWGGPLGVARDWCASVGLDPSTGTGWAGGYVGDGVEHRTSQGGPCATSCWASGPT